MMQPIPSTAAPPMYRSALVRRLSANVHLADLALQLMKLYAPISGIIGRPLVKEGAYITKEVRNQSRVATVVQLDPIHVVGQAPAGSYFQRDNTSTSLEEVAAQREFSLILPTGEKYPDTGRFVAGNYEFDPETQTVEVTVEFPNPDRPGLDVTLQSSIPKK
jgi:multidrug efflux pump subunit AcrA (membrane-fusion protein)